MLQAAQTGDTEALNGLCERYRPTILSYLQQRGLKSEAEDLAQEVLMGLVEALPKVHPGAGRFRSLVFAVASNKVAMYFRHQSAKKRGGGAIPLIEDPDIYPSASDPDDLFDREWLESLVRRCLSRLRRDYLDQYTALKLFVLEGRPQAEIAEAEGVSAATIRKRVWRGKRNVTAFLQEEVETYALSRNDAEEELRYLNSLLGPLGSDGSPSPD